MSQWVIPYIDQPAGFWTRLADRYGEHIEEVYLPMPQGWMPSGRSRQPETHLEAFLRSAPLPKAVLINPIVLPEPIADSAPRILERLRACYERYGVRNVTVTSLELARAIRESLPFMHITASCLMGIAAPAQALLLQEHVDSLTPDTRLCHDLHGLRRVKAAFKGRTRLLVNESCLPGCPLRTQHFYEMAYSTSFPQSLCGASLAEMPWMRMTGGWILPQHLHYYTGAYDSLKLAGRVTLQDPQRYLHVLGAYIQGAPLTPDEIGGGPASILKPLDIPDALFETILNCDKDCHRCSICRDFYEAHTHA